MSEDIGRGGWRTGTVGHHTETITITKEQITRATQSCGKVC